MKEATGEANMTIVTVVLIGIITLVAVPIIRGLIGNTGERAECVNNGGTWNNGECIQNDVTGGTGATPTA